MSGSLEAALEGAIEACRKTSGMADFRSSPGERGVLAGKPCIRGRFSARIGAATMHGQMVMFVEGHRLVGMTAMSTEPEESTEQQQLNAAVLSFRQR